MAAGPPKLSSWWPPARQKGSLVPARDRDPCLMLGTMDVQHELHACDGVRLPFDTACTVLDGHRHDILQQATHLLIVRSQGNPAAGWPGAEPRVVTAALERDGERSATMAMHWIAAGAPSEDYGGLVAWLHARLRLLPRQMGSIPVTELLLTARCETTPQEPDAFNDELCASFLREVAAGIERTAAAERAPR